MKTLTLQRVLLAILCVISSSCTVMDQEPATDKSDVFTKPAPEFPKPEYQNGTEGWVVIDYSVGRGGVVEYLHIRDSSGSSNFEDSAIAAVQNWRYEPGEERELSVFLGFVHDGDKTSISEEFHSLNQQANELIDDGELERASEILAKARDDDELSLIDRSYSYLTEGRIAGESGDRAKQLELYRKALLGNGRWLAYENYLEVLHGTVILGLDQGDIASAVRDYDLLAATLNGRKLGRNVEDEVEAARAQVNADPSVMEPYVVADNSVMVLPDQPARHFGTRPPRPPGSYGTSSKHNPPPRSSRSGSKKD